MGISLYRSEAFDPFVRLINSTIINKADSGSGHERTYWNVKSLQSFLDTSGLGVGFGSSRASSWPIAVLSQLGLFGSLMMGGLLCVLARGLGAVRQWVDPETDAVVASVRNAALASIIAMSVSGGSADPGILFFIALAVVCATRVSARRGIAAFERSGPASADGAANVVYSGSAELALRRQRLLAMCQGPVMFKMDGDVD